MRPISIKNKLTKGYIKQQSKAYIDRDVLHKELKYQGITKYQMWELMYYHYGADIQYNTLSLLLNNKKNWRLDYALIISDILRVPVSSLFYLKRGTWDYDGEKK